MNLADALSWRAVPETAVQLFYEHLDEILEKQAESPFLREMATLAQIRPGQMFGAIPNHATPLTAMLVGGLAGSGLGYGLGSVAEGLLPQQWERGRLRRTLAMLGGGLGAMPGLGMAAINAYGGDPPWKQTFGAGYVFPSTTPTVPKYRLNPVPLQPKPLPAQQLDAEPYAKMASEYMTGIGAMQPVDVNEFNQVIWQDPRVARPLTPAVQAAATGLVTGAANLPGRHNARLVTPLDIGRMAAGMGTGYASGVLVGQALGALMGLPEESQDRLKQTGTWAGIVANLIPIAFGG